MGRLGWLVGVNNHLHFVAKIHCMDWKMTLDNCQTDKRNVVYADIVASDDPEASQYASQLTPPLEVCSSKNVRWAPGPDEIACKYNTHDGHPDHEGCVARQKRRKMTAYGIDLTPQSVKALELELGESCRASLDRLKRRVGLLPLRQRPQEYITHKTKRKLVHLVKDVPAKCKIQRRGEDSPLSVEQAATEAVFLAKKALNIKIPRNVTAEATLKAATNAALTAKATLKTDRKRLGGLHDSFSTFCSRTHTKMWTCNNLYCLTNIQKKHTQAS